MTGLCLGIDLGGTKVELALVHLDGRRVDSDRLLTGATGGPERVIEDVAAGARELLARAEAPVTGAGIGVAGQVDGRRGVVRTAPNLEGWRDVPLAAALNERIGLPVALLNDVNATALAEHTFGAGRGVDDLVVVFVGTGVGGGVVTGGRLLDGADGYASELGHVTIVAGGRRCSCGNRGCLEAYCGGWAIAERAREAVDGAGDEGRDLLALAGDAGDPGDADGITAATVGRAAAAGDPLALRLVEETGRLLGAGLVGIVHAFNPRRVVLGGGVIAGIPELIGIAAERVRSGAMAVFQEGLEVVPGALGTEAGVVGAALFARRRFGKEAA